MFFLWGESLKGMKTTWKTTGQKSCNTVSWNKTISGVSPERIGEKYRLCRHICTFHFRVYKFIQRNYRLWCVNITESIAVRPHRSTDSISPPQSTQNGNGHFLEYIPSRWYKQPRTVGGGGGASPPPFIISTITYKVVVYAPAERADTLLLFLLYPSLYSVVTPPTPPPLPIPSTDCAQLHSDKFGIILRRLAFA